MEKISEDSIAFTSLFQSQDMQEQSSLCWPLRSIVGDPSVLYAIHLKGRFLGKMYPLDDSLPSSRFTGFLSICPKKNYR